MTNLIVLSSILLTNQAGVSKVSADGFIVASSIYRETRVGFVSSNGIVEIGTLIQVVGRVPWPSNYPQPKLKVP